MPELLSCGDAREPLRLRKRGKKAEKWLMFRQKYLKPLQNDEGFWVCVLCGTWTAYPDVDHIQGRAARPDLIFDESNLRVLCRECHRKHHG